MKKLFVLVLSMWLTTVSASACGVGAQAPEGYENAPLIHAYQHWQQGEQAQIPFVFLDVRTPEEFAAGHIPGAVNIPVQELATRMSEVPANKRVYVYCRSGKRAAKASAMLARAGYHNIENVPDSMDGWRAAGYPVEK